MVPWIPGNTTFKIRNISKELRQKLRTRKFNSQVSSYRLINLKRFALLIQFFHRDQSVTEIQSVLREWTSVLYQKYEVPKLRSRYFEESLFNIF